LPSVLAQKYQLPGQGQFALAVGPEGSMAKRILVADDNALIRRMLCQLFAREEDYDICAEAANGQEAIDLALKHRPDLIILDWAMPVVNGLVAARELKKIMPDVPIILFSQHANALIRIEMSVDRIVPKTDALALMEHVRALAPV
jgi:DNA-binding NarL/FixJ family response regulator